MQLCTAWKADDTSRMLDTWCDGRNRTTDHPVFNPATDHSLTLQKCKKPPLWTASSPLPRMVDQFFLTLLLLFILFHIFIIRFARRRG